jgi:transposase
VITLRKDSRARNTGQVTVWNFYYSYVQKENKMSQKQQEELDQRKQNQQELEQQQELQRKLRKEEQQQLEQQLDQKRKKRQQS